MVLLFELADIDIYIIHLHLALARRQVGLCHILRYIRSSIQSYVLHLLILNSLSLIFTCIQILETIISDELYVLQFADVADVVYIKWLLFVGLNDVHGSEDAELVVEVGLLVLGYDADGFFALCVDGCTEGVHPANFENLLGI